MKFLWSGWRCGPIIRKVPHFLLTLQQQALF